MSAFAGIVAVLGLFGTVAVLSTSVVHGQAPSGDALAQLLRQGGYVMVMRHASSPREAPDKKIANADNVKLEACSYPGPWYGSRVKRHYHPMRLSISACRAFEPRFERRLQK